MNTKHNIYLFIFTLLSLFSSKSFAEDYYWLLRSPNGIMSYTKFPNPGAACSALSLSARATQDPYTFRCQDSSNSSTVFTSREGHNCPPGSTYNQSTGNCDAPAASDGTVCHDESVAPPRVIQGGVCVNLGGATPQTQCKYFAGTGNVQKRTFWIYEGSGKTTDLTVQNLQDKTGCEIAPTSEIKPEADCKYLPPTPAVPYFAEGVLMPGIAQPGAYRCKVSSALTGNYTPPSTGAGQKPADTICADPGSPACSLPDVNKKEQKPCTYSSDSQGNQVCVSSKFEASPGKTKCGYVGSEFKCSEDLNKAVGEGLSIATKVETKPQPDGKTKITKTDVQTATSCKGTSCTTKTTTTTTTTIKDGSGTTESVSGTCTGDNCPDKNTNPDGDGDGFGDCTGDDCGEGEGGSPETPQLEEVDGYQETTQKFYGRAKSSPLLSAVSDINAPTAGVAPNFQSDPIQALGGARADFGIIGQLVPNIDFLALVMKAVWCFIAVVVFLLA